MQINDNYLTMISTIKLSRSALCQIQQYKIKKSFIYGMQCVKFW